MSGETTLAPTSEIKLSADELRELEQEISLIVTEHRGDTHEFIRNLTIQRRLYNLLARPKTWPWKGSANFIAPIIRHILSHYISRLKQSFRQVRDIWHATHEGKTTDEATGIDWTRASKSASKLLNGLSQSADHLDLNKTFFPDVVDMLVRDGTVPIKVHFFTDEEVRYVAGRGGKPEAVVVETDRHVVWDPIPIHQCIWSIGASDAKDSPVLGHWIEKSRAAMRRFLVKYKIPKDIAEAVLKTPDVPYYLEELRILDDEVGVQRSDGQSAKTLGTYRLFELSVDYDSENRQPGILKVWWHPGSNRIIKVFGTPNLRHTWHIARFQRRGKQFLGESLGEPLRGLNLGANAVINQSIDAQTAANARGIGFKAGGKAAAAIMKGGVYPGFRVPFDEDFRKEIGVIELGSGNVSAAMLSLLNFFLSMSEMIGKVGQSQTGQVGAGSRVAASVGLGIMQESNQMIDSVTNSFKDTVVDCGYETLYLYANHAPEVFDEFLEADESEELLQALKQTDFQRQVRLAITVTSASSSREKDKQDLIVLANFLLGIYEKLLNMAVPFTDPSIPPEWKKVAVFVYKGMENVIHELIERFEQFKDPKKPLPEEIGLILEQLASANPMMGAMGGAPGLPRAEVPGGGGGAQMTDQALGSAIEEAINSPTSMSGGESLG